MIIIGRMPARLARARPRPSPRRAAGRSCRSARRTRGPARRCSSDVVLASSASVGSERDRRRRACAAPRRPARRSPRRISARRSAVSGRGSSPTSSCEQRASSTSGAPLVKTSSALAAFRVACGRCSSACARRRTAPRRRARSARRARRRSSPALRAATSSAPSVGSPCTVQRPSLLLQRRRCSRGRRRRARARARSRSAPSIGAAVLALHVARRRVAGAAERRRARSR